MTSAILHPSQSLAKDRPSVGEALRDLSVAALRLAQALWAAATQPRPVPQAMPLTAFDEAEELRALADAHVLSDPCFAQDLYAAADRHERAARA